MSSVGSIIEVFKMDEISPVTRVRVMIKLGKAINYEYGSNMTEELVYELLDALGVKEVDCDIIHSFVKHQEKMMEFELNRKTTGNTTRAVK